MILPLKFFLHEIVCISSLWGGTEKFIHNFLTNISIRKLHRIHIIIKWEVGGLDSILSLNGLKLIGFLKKCFLGHSRPLFVYFRLFNTAGSKCSI